MAMSGESRRSTLPLRVNQTGSGLLLVAMALLAFGTVMVYSASAKVTLPGEGLARVDMRHAVYAVLAAMVLAVLWRVDYHVLARGKGLASVAGFGLIASVVLSILVLIPGIGAEINGARRWFHFEVGSLAVSFQPSELIKLSLVAFLACWLGRKGRDVRSFGKAFLPATAVIGVCVVLVMVEDFGTATVIGMTAVAVLVVAGVRWYYLLMLVPPAAAGFYFMVVCKEARWARIMAFIDPWNQDNWRTFQGRQALITIGSGGTWGRGLGNGQMKRGFLPEVNTDFVFAVICEELGFVGAGVLLGLIAMLLYFSWRSADSSSDKTGRLLATGIGTLIVVQALLHVAVNIGAAPPTGMSLPLVSAGGTALLLTAAAVAMIVSVTAHPSGSDDPVERT